MVETDWRLSEGKAGERVSRSRWGSARGESHEDTLLRYVRTSSGEYDGGDHWTPKGRKVREEKSAATKVW